MDRDPTVPTTLLTLPQELFGNILGEVDYKSLVSLRKVCKPFRKLIDTLNPNIHVVILNLIISDKGISCELIFNEDDDGSIIWIEYHEDPKGCAVIFEDNEKCIEGKSPLVVFEEDSQMIWKHLKSELKEINVKVWGGDYERLGQMIDCHFEILREVGQPVQVKNVYIESDLPCENLTRSLVAHLDPNVFHKLRLKLKGDDRRIVQELPYRTKNLKEMDTWRSAKELDTKNILMSMPMNEFSHFDRLATVVETVKPDELDKLVHAITRSTTFQSYIIGYHHCEEVFQAYKETPLPHLDNVEFFKNEVIEIVENRTIEERELGVDVGYRRDGKTFYEHLMLHYIHGMEWDGQDEGVGDFHEGWENDGLESDDDVYEMDSDTESSDAEEEKEKSKEEKPEEKFEEDEEIVSTWKFFGIIGSDEEDKKEDKPEDKPEKLDIIPRNLRIFDSREEQPELERPQLDQAEVARGGPREIPPPPTPAFPGHAWYFKMENLPNQLLVVKHCKWNFQFYFSLCHKSEAAKYAIIHEIDLNKPRKVPKPDGFRRLWPPPLIFVD